MNIDFSERDRFTVEGKGVSAEFVCFTEGSVLVQIFDKSGMKIGHFGLDFDELDRINPPAFAG